MMFLSPGVSRRLIYVFCALVLFAQQAALTHVASHLAGAHQQGQAADRPDGDRSPASDLAKLCDLDALFGQLLSGGPASCHAAFAAESVSHTALHLSGAYTPADALTPRSRGPPLLL